MDEAADPPPYMLMVDKYFAVYQRRRRRLVSGEAPAGLNGDRPMHARDWRVYQNRMGEEPAWERAERYLRIMQEKGYRSIRALAKAVGEDHSRVARVLKVLELPETVLAKLQKHSNNARIRAYFTERRLRAAQKDGESKILRQIAKLLTEAL
jgi:hypothetical protein